MSRYRYIIMLFIISASVLLGLLGIKWGIPSVRRADMVMPEKLRTEEFYGNMSAGREEIYKYSGGSGIGRIQNSSLTPVLKSMGIGEGENLYFDGDRKVLANFIRPFLLRTNHTDEQMTITALSVMKPKKLELNPKIFQYGGVYIYGMGAYFYTAGFLKILDVSGDIKTYFSDPAKMGKIFIAGRAVNTVFFALCLAVIYLTGRKAHSETAGIIASILFLFCPGAVFQAHIMKPYMAASFLALLCLYFSVFMCAPGFAKKYSVLCGAFLGLTAGAMPLYGLIIVAPLSVMIMYPENILKKAAYVFLTAAAVFFITNPYWIFDFSSAVAELAGTRTIYSSGISISQIISFFSAQLPLNISLGPLMACLAGIAYCAVNPVKKNILMLVSGLLPLVVFGWLIQRNSISIHNSRFMLPWLVPFFILGASLIAESLSESKLKLAAALFMFVAVSVSCLNVAVIEKNFIIDSSTGSTRFMAGRWINENIPAGSVIGLKDMPEPAFAPYFDFEKYKIAVIFNFTDSAVPDYFVAVNGIPEKLRAAANYEVAKEFRPVDSMLGVKYSIGVSHVNAPFVIYRKKV